MPLKNSLLVMASFAVGLAGGWVATYETTQKRHNQVFVDTQLADAGRLLATIGQPTLAIEIKNELLILVLEKATLAASIPHKIEDLQRAALIGLCALIDRTKSPEPFGARATPEMTEVALKYLASAHAVAQDQAMQARNVLPKNTCGI